MTKSTCTNVGLIVAQSLPFAPARQLYSERHFVRKNVGERVTREPVWSNKNASFKGFKVLLCCAVNVFKLKKWFSVLKLINENLVYYKKHG